MWLLRTSKTSLKVLEGHFLSRGAFLGHLEAILKSIKSVSGLCGPQSRSGCLSELQTPPPKDFLIGSGEGAGWVQ